MLVTLFLVATVCLILGTVIGHVTGRRSSQPLPSTDPIDLLLDEIEASTPLSHRLAHAPGGDVNAEWHSVRMSDDITIAPKPVDERLDGMPARIYVKKLSIKLSKEQQERTDKIGRAHLTYLLTKQLNDQFIKQLEPPEENGPCF